MIDQPTIDRILDASNIVDVVSEFVTLRKRGVNYVGLCPFHSDKSPSFYVSPSKNICKCFACGEGGTAVHFIMKHEQLSYFDALRVLAKKYNIDIQERELTDAEKQVKNDRESMLIVNSFAQKYFSSMLYEHMEGKNIGFVTLPNGVFGRTLYVNSSWDTVWNNGMHSFWRQQKADIERNFWKKPVLLSLMITEVWRIVSVAA